MFKSFSSSTIAAILIGATGVINAIKGWFGADKKKDENQDEEKKDGAEEKKEAKNDRPDGGDEKKHATQDTNPAKTSDKQEVDKTRQSQSDKPRQKGKTVRGGQSSGGDQEMDDMQARKQYQTVSAPVSTGLTHNG